MKFSFIQAFFASAALTVAVPVQNLRPGLDVVKTTVLEDGQVLDWVRRESQDDNFSLPADYGSNHKRHPILEKYVTPIPEHLRGPKGTVPIPRSGLAPFPPKQLPPLNGPARAHAAFKAVDATPDYTGQHWYASTSNPLNVTGGGATISMFKPYLASDQDFSLLQVAMIRYEANTGDYGTITQTLETGWMYYPPRSDKPMFFTFFNTNGYQGNGDYVCGWNTEQKGWVQVDDSIYPGMSFDKMSVIGGEQHDFDVKYHLTDGKWWLKAFGRDIGYYPADLFSQNSKVDDTLASYGDTISFYGEVYNSGSALTATDMGSGNFPSAGTGKVGYLRNMVYIDKSGKEQTYGGYTDESDSSRYQIKLFYKSKSSWDSYVYVGGPGAGGVVGG